MVTCTKMNLKRVKSLRMIIIDIYHFLTNFKNILKFKIKFKEADINRGNRQEWGKLHGFNLSQFKLDTRKDQIYRNCVHPETGRHILNCALDKDYEHKSQGSLF